MLPHQIQGSKAWLEFRKSKVTASEAPIIMRESPWCTPLELWEQKIGLVQPTERNWAMQRGIDMEPTARYCFEQETGIFVSPAVIEHPNIHYMIASLDGMSEDKCTIVEIKCAGKKDHATAVSGEIPKKYYAQLQHQMEVAQLDMTYYYSFDGKTGVVLECIKNVAYVEKMLAKEFKFWQHIQFMTIPEDA